MFNEDSCSFICFDNKMYENVVYSVSVTSQQPFKPSL